MATGSHGEKRGGSNPPAPSFYTTAAKMAQAQGGAGGAGGESGKPGTQAGQSGEKVRNVKVLLEVFDKMDKLEQDQSGKDMIRQMADLAKQYMEKLEGKGPGTEKSKPATGEAGSTPATPPPDMTGGGAGGGAGAGTGDMTGAAA